eukprot:scaffold18317_cov129-Isochrysis_galbana.AAC.4
MAVKFCLLLVDLGLCGGWGSGSERPGREGSATLPNDRHAWGLKCRIARTCIAFSSSPSDLSLRAQPSASSAAASTSRCSCRCIAFTSWFCPSARAADSCKSAGHEGGSAAESHAHWWLKRGDRRALVAGRASAAGRLLLWCAVRTLASAWFSSSSYSRAPYLEWDGKPHCPGVLRPVLAAPPGAAAPQPTPPVGSTWLHAPSSSRRGPVDGQSMIGTPCTMHTTVQAPARTRLTSWPHLEICELVPRPDVK